MAESDKKKIANAAAKKAAKAAAKKAAKKAAKSKAATTKKAATKKSVKPAKKSAKGAKNISGYGMGKVDVVMSVDQVGKEAAKIAVNAPKDKDLDNLAKNDEFLTIDKLCAGYGKMQILHDFTLKIAKGQSLCLIGPNGAGKSTVLHSIFGFTNIFSGDITIGGKNVTKLTPSG